MKVSVCYFIPLLLGILGCQERSPSLTSYVDPFIGSDETDFVSLWRSEAGLYPGAVAPHGMLQLTPETQEAREYLQGYFYKKDTIRRFSMTEHFSGWPSGSAGKGIFMPFLTEEYESISPQTLKSSYRHDEETAEVGYYSVSLRDHGISCEFSSLVRSAMGRMTFKGAGKVGIACWGFKSFEALDEHTVYATLTPGRKEFLKGNQTIHLVLTFQDSIACIEAEVGRRKNWRVVPRDEQTRALNFKIGISYSSRDNAFLNLQTEIPHWKLHQVRADAKALWEQELSRIELEGEEEDKITFYTALYHASLLPVNVTDVNGQFPGYEVVGPLGKGETHYQYFTPWDAFRTLHPLVNFINPRKAEDFMASALRYYQAYGILPEPAVMTAVHTSLLYADALAQGVSFDVETAFNGLRELMLEEPYFRKEMSAYDSLGYVPFPERYATTATLEFALNDWALARIASHLGHEEIAERLYQRSLNYRTQFEPQSRFMRSKKSDGSWAPASIYAEADKWNMSWFVPHDVQGLINLMGGNEAFCEKLEQNLAEGHYVLDNECPMNFPYLFSYAGRPDLSMKWSRDLLRQYFKNQPYGVPGNDDWGTMSSWFIWGAMGLFPASPGTGEFVIASPLFEKITIHRSPTEQMQMKANNVSEKKRYVQSASLNGEVVTSCVVHSQDLVNGSLVLEMGQQPALSFGKQGPKPYSLTQSSPQFQVKSLSLSQESVAANQAFTVRAEVKNMGEMGSYRVKVKEADSILYERYFLMGEEETRNIEVDLRLYTTGLHTLSLDGKQVSVEVRAVALPEKEAIVIRDWAVSALVNQADRLEWTTSVQNVSGQEVSFTPELWLGDSLIERLGGVLLSPGQEKTLRGDFSVKGLSGFQKLRLSHGPVARFRVFEKATETLVAHYTFDKRRASVQDHSGFGNHGVVHGEVEWVAGISGGGMRFSNGYLSIPKSESMEFEGDEMTLLCWYRTGAQERKAPLITKGTFHQLKLEGRWQLKFAAGSWGRGQCYDNARPKADKQNQPSWQGQWTQFAGVKSPGNIHIFVNGESRNQLNHLGPMGSTEFEWRIGSNQEHPHQHPDGLIDEVMIFQGALSQEEIREMYRQVQARPK